MENAHQHDDRPAGIFGGPHTVVHARCLLEITKPRTLLIFRPLAGLGFTFTEFHLLTTHPDADRFRPAAA